MSSEDRDLQPQRLYVISARNMGSAPTGRVKFEYPDSSDIHGSVSDLRTIKYVSTEESMKTMSQPRSSIRLETERPGASKAQPPRPLFKLDLWMTTYMLSFTVLGVIAAAGHHVFLTHLHHRPADVTSRGGVSIQRQASLGSLSLMFLAKFFFSLSIAKAYDQRIWVSANKNFIQLRGLDALFTALHDPFAFSSLNMVSNAKLATIMAAVVWLLPIALFPIPGALTVQSLTISRSESLNVPGVNLLQDPGNGTLAVYNTTGSYRGPSSSTQTLANRVLLSSLIPAWSNPCSTNSSFCSYNQTFFAPSFNCSAPRNSTINDSDFRHWFGTVSTGLKRDYFNVSWVGGLNATEMLSTSCTSWNASYDISVRFPGPEVLVKSITPIREFGTANPGNWTIPNANETSRGLAAGGNSFGLALLSAVKDSVSKSLSGSIYVDPDTGLVVPDSTLVLLNPSLPVNVNGPGSLYFRSDANNIIRDILTNTSISLMSLGLWTTSTTALVETSGEVFVYEPFILVIGYGVSLGVTILMILIGLHAEWRNGSARDIRFSTIVKASRNRVLDRYMELRQRGMSEQAFSKDFLDLKLRYGRVKFDEGRGWSARRMAFGIETQLGKED